MRHTDGVKAKVILEWQSGSSKHAISREHGVPIATVSRWLKGVERVALERPPEPKTKSLPSLAYELASESFNAAIAILRLAQDREWLASQNANDLAILFGVNADKLMRLLPAFADLPGATGGDNADAGGSGEGAPLPTGSR